MKANFLKTYEHEITTLVFCHSKPLRMKGFTHKQKQKYSNHLLLTLDSPTYRRFEYEYDKETLHIKISYSFLFAHLSIISLFFASMIYKTAPICFYFFLSSVMFFFFSVLLSKHCRKYAWEIDDRANFITDEIIDDTREKMLSGEFSM